MQTGRKLEVNQHKESKEDRVIKWYEHFKNLLGSNSNTNNNNEETIQRPSAETT